MANSSYDLDDILNEVKKRREENEAKIKGSLQPPEKETEESPSDEPEEYSETPAEQAENAQESEALQENAPEEAENSFFRQTEQTEEESPAQEATLSDSAVQDKPENTDQTQTEEEEHSVDLLALSEQSSAGQSASYAAHGKKSSQKWHKTKTGKICIFVIVFLCAAIIAAGIYGYFFINNALDRVTDNDTHREANLEQWTGMDVLKESFDPIYEDGRANISSYRDMVKKWYYNGTPASSTHVLNVLLIGEDTRDEEIEETGYRADSAIVASVNVDTGEIILTSILRDCYAYWETTEGDESTGQFGKINGAMSTGGLNCYIDCVEHMFKINIDNYVLVNFDSFESIVDTLGGVTVNLTRAEIREINNHQKTYNHVTIEGEPGELELDGRQALAYCRIRHIDGDDVRADRQKTVLLQLFKKMKSASTIKTTEVATDLLPYVKTGFSKSEILSIGKYAMSHGWLDYETVTYTAPTNETKPDGTVVTTCKGGTNYGAWVWKVDYPLCSQIVQNKIYGKTNIELAEKRPKFLELSNY